MGRTACTEPQCLYKGTLYLYLWSWKSRAIPLFPLWAVWPVQSLSACTRVTFTFTFVHERVELYLYSPYGPYSLYRASVPVQGYTLPFTYRPMTTKLTSFADHGGQMLEMEMEENPLHRRGDTAEKVLCSPSQVPFIIDQSGRIRDLVVLGHGDPELDMVFRESCMNGRRETADKVLCSSSKVPYIIDRSPPNFQAFCRNTL
jgi:hypothetical protein